MPTKGNNCEQKVSNRFLAPEMGPWTKTDWSWPRTTLLVIALLAFVDSFFVPISRDVDLGRSAEGLLFLIICFRAVSRRKIPPSSLVIARAFLAALPAS